jgi:hypothetical protein
MLHIEGIIDHWPAPTPGRVTGPTSGSDSSPRVEHIDGKPEGQE